MHTAGGMILRRSISLNSFFLSAHSEIPEEAVTARPLSGAALNRGLTGS